MTNELAVIEGGAAARGSVDLLAVARQADQVKTLGAMLIQSGLLPDSIKKPETAMGIMLKGQELGLPAMYSLAEITIIQGKPAPSEQLIGTLIRRAGHKLRVIETTDEHCTVEGVRGDDPAHKQRVTFSLDDAKRAGLLGKNSWKNYPRAMLRARAKGELARGMFEDALAGMSYTPEELGAEVDEEGQVLDSTPVVEGEVVEEPGEKTLHPREQDRLRELIKETGHSIERFEEKVGSIEEIDSDTGLSWIKRLARKKDEQAGGEPQGEYKSETGVAATRGGARDRPATKEQITFLGTLALETWEDGVAELERRVGKPLSEFSHKEASDWVNRLARGEEGEEE